MQRTIITSFHEGLLRILSQLVCDEFATPETDVPIRGGERGQVERVKTLGDGHDLADFRDTEE